MKKFFLCSACLVLLTSCQAMKHFNPLPYKESVEVREKVDLTSQYNPTPCFDRTGYVYHYIKSNQDDSLPADVWIYYTSPYHSESFKIYPMSKIQGFLDCVVANYNPSTFQAKTLEGKRVRKNGKIQDGIVGTLDNYERKVIMGKKEMVNEIGIQPCYDINFDLTDMNSMLPFLKDNKKDFSFGLTNVRKDSLLAQPSFLYLGELKASYIGVEEYKGKTCSVYSLVLQNFEELDGKMYIDTLTNDLVEVNTKLCGNPFYKNFKFTLIDKQRTTEEEWLTFMRIHAKEKL